MASLRLNFAAGTPHTLRNTSGTEVRLVKLHRPALDFERFFRRLHGLVCLHRVKLPAKDLRSAILVQSGAGGPILAAARL